MPLGHHFPNFTSLCVEFPTGPIASQASGATSSPTELVPVGCVGELYIGGPGVCSGYWRRPDLTARALVSCPHLSPLPLYRTGDFVRLDSRGLLHFVGRADFQVKLRGQRLELGEIEAVLQRDLRVAAVLLAKRVPHQAVAAAGDGSAGSVPMPAGEAYLAAYVQPRADVVLAADAAESAGHEASASATLGPVTLPAPSSRALCCLYSALVAPRATLLLFFFMSAVALCRHAPPCPSTLTPPTLPHAVAGSR